ncbi:NUDIX hydrolase [Wohlfahrtiimonas larvae]|uniref:NUDIX domain-containing protein n=1 Tax=Wohlfahrtiimonas larvae TaxID=1157986 RepID=A0ABP9MK37_9GAMM|nr:NUDIX domain-containing protein [Wohlfahrtiimonas larvae]
MERKPNYFYLSAAMIIDSDDRLLLVRKRNTAKFMLPGGKIDQGENAIEALVRELQEEIDLNIQESDATFIQEYEAAAANEPDYRIQSQLFHVILPANTIIEPQAEIEEIIWLEPNHIPALQFAPLVEEKILPLWQDFLDKKR